VYGTNSHHLGRRLSVQAGSTYHAEVRVRADIGPGRYSVTVAVTGASHFDRCHHWWDDAASFTVAGIAGEYFEGIVRLSPSLTWELSEPLTSHAAEVALEGPAPATLEAGACAAVRVRVRNASPETWPTRGARPVRLGHHWLRSPDGAMILYEGARTGLPRDLPPGQEVTLEALVEAPEVPGPYLLRLTMVQERTAWFEDCGVAPLDVPISVVSAAAPGHRSAPSAGSTAG
jgi:hypothetical protein